MTPRGPLTRVLQYIPSIPAAYQIWHARELSCLNDARRDSPCTRSASESKFMDSPHRRENPYDFERRIADSVISLRELWRSLRFVFFFDANHLQVYFYRESDPCTSSSMQQKLTPFDVLFLSSSCTECYPICFITLEISSSISHSIQIQFYFGDQYCLEPRVDPLENSQNRIGTDFLLNELTYGIR